MATNAFPFESYDTIIPTSVPGIWYLCLPIDYKPARNPASSKTSKNAKHGSYHAAEHQHPSISAVGSIVLIAEFTTQIADRGSVSAAVSCGAGGTVTLFCLVYVSYHTYECIQRASENVKTPYLMFTRSRAKAAHGWCSTAAHDGVRSSTVTYKYLVWYVDISPLLQD